MTTPALLQLEGIRKEFPGCLANDNISLDITPGEIHALLGENGAGKSTLVKIIYGVLRPDQGQIRWHTVTEFRYRTPPGPVSWASAWCSSTSHFSNP